MLPKKAVDGGFLEVLKAGLAGILGSLSWWKATLPMANV